MGLIEDAKHLASFPPVDSGVGDECTFCEGPWHSAGDDERDWWVEHSRTCPWLALPRIVKALEAAGALVDADSLGEETQARHALADAFREPAP